MSHDERIPLASPTNHPTPCAARLEVSEQAAEADDELTVEQLVTTTAKELKAWADATGGHLPAPRWRADGTRVRTDAGAQGAGRRPSHGPAVTMLWDPAWGRPSWTPALESDGGCVRRRAALPWPRIRGGRCRAARLATRAGRPLHSGGSPGTGGGSHGVSTAVWACRSAVWMSVWCSSPRTPAQPTRPSHPPWPQWGAVRRTWPANEESLGLATKPRRGPLALAHSRYWWRIRRTEMWPSASDQLLARSAPLPDSVDSDG